MLLNKFLNSDHRSTSSRTAAWMPWACITSQGVLDAFVSEPRGVISGNKTISKWNTAVLIEIRFFYILFFNEPLKHYNKSILFDFELKGVYIRGFDNRSYFLLRLNGPRRAVYGISVFLYVNFKKMTSWSFFFVLWTTKHLASTQ